jgi:hypothetical protein
MTITAQDLPNILAKHAKWANGEADGVRADLSGANLSGAKWRDDIIINRNPLVIAGLPYLVYILDQHMQIGCELHTLTEWGEFDDDRIARMDGVRARKFWDKFKVSLLALATAD